MLLMWIQLVMVVEQFTAHFKMFIFKNRCDMQQRFPVYVYVKCYQDNKKGDDTQ